MRSSSTIFFMNRKFTDNPI